MTTGLPVRRTRIALLWCLQHRATSALDHHPGRSGERHSKRVGRSLTESNHRHATCQQRSVPGVALVTGRSPVGPREGPRSALIRGVCDCPIGDVAGAAVVRICVCLGTVAAARPRQAGGIRGAGGAAVPRSRRCPSIASVGCVAHWVATHQRLGERGPVRRTHGRRGQPDA